ncbi:glycoside hydrolase family 18 protein [Roseospira navarrensis]|nr:glycoside hydrolase family 18 protein [Roseospira navarrensis]
MPTTDRMVNAWIFLNEDEPSGTTYSDPTSCYQTLIRDGVYGAVDILYLCFATTLPVGPETVPATPAAQAGSYTIAMGAASHAGGLTNQDYMDWVIRDARASNPSIRIAMTLNWGDGSLLSNIFTAGSLDPEPAAKAFAANLLAYLRRYDLDGFDIDWESPISDQTTREQFRCLVTAIGAAFRAQTDRKFYLTLSPAAVGNLDAAAVNDSVDFVNLQLYSGFTDPAAFTAAGVDAALFAYGAKFESDVQTAQAAYDDNAANYGYPIFTCWRLNSSNFAFEQAQQKALSALVFPS